MISLQTVFWAMVAFFALMGLLRGWTKEVIATAGLILSLFAISLAASTNVIRLIVPDPTGFQQVLASQETLQAYNVEGSIPGFVPDLATQNVISALKREFYILTIIHLAITFFSYQGPTLAGRSVADRLRVRDSIQDKLLGGIIGAVNGYLVIGTLWSFLEYRVTSADLTRLAPGLNYVFYPLIQRPPDAYAIRLLEQLPMPLLQPYLPFLLVAMFLFVIIVMI